MKTFFSKCDFLFGRLAENRNTPNVHYSKTDFFCESQQSQCEKENAREKEVKIETKEKKRDRFFGHFNMFF